MPSWRDMAAAAQPARTSEPAVETFGLPSHLALGLRRLETLPAPKLEIPGNWAVAVRDAMELARSGWAAKALALGWSEHDLFGVGPESSDQFSGLAVWLDGWRVAAIDDCSAVAISGDGRASYQPSDWRHGLGNLRPVFLWRLGRGG